MKIAVLVFLMALPVWANAFQVELITSKTECLEGESVIIEIQVFPATPAGTVLSVESIPDSFSLTASRKERRSREDDSPFSGGRVDSVVFVQEWTGSRAGSYRLGPFIVRVDGIEQVLAPVDLLVIERESAGMGEVRWTLANPGTEIRTGTPVSLILEARHVPELLSLSAPLPKNALLEKIGNSFENTPDSGQEWRPIATFLWTPLFDGTQALPAVELEYRDRGGESSRARNRPRVVSVLANDPSESKTVDSFLLSEAFTVLEETGSDKDQSVREYPPPESLREPRKSALVPAAGYWKEKEYAASLAHLRRLEHTRLFRSSIRNIRLEAEEILGISATLPVWSKPLLQLILFFFILCVATTLGLITFRRRSRRVSRLLAASCGIAALLLVAAVFLLVPARRSYAVSRGGSLRQIPEQTAGITAAIPEGTPVTILKRAGSWYYVSIPASLEGWVTRDEAIPYTAAGFHGLW